MRIIRFIANFTIMLILLLSGASTLHSVDANGSAYQTEYSVQFSMNELSFDRVMDYDIVRLKDRSYISDEGYPMLPSKRVRIALPEGIAVESVRAVNIKNEEISGEFNIFPAQHPVEFSYSNSEMVFTEPNAEIYNSSAPYPSAPVEFIRQSDLAGQAIAEINLYPVQYLPAEKKLMLLTSITFAVEGNYGYECGDYLPDNISEEGKRIYEQHLKEILRNKEDIVLRTAPPGQKRSPALPSETPFDHVIITSSSNAPHFQPLANWHTRKGVRDTVITVEYIYANYDGDGEKGKIRNFVIDAHQNWGTMYYLFGGEHTSVPFEYREYNGTPIPSDAYYGDYDDDWEYEVFVGRISAEGSVEITRFVNKILKYEQAPPKRDFPRDVTLLGMDLTIASDPPYYTLTRGQALKDSIYTGYIPPDLIITTIYDTDGDNHREAFLEALNDGQNLINHCDHSNSRVMGTGDRNHGWYISIYDIPYLTNYHRYGIINSLGCHANEMDYEDAISEKFVFSTDSTGAVAFVGNTRSGWFYVGDPMSLSSELDLQWWVGLFDHDKYRLGEALAFAKSAVNTDQTWPYSEWTLNLLGDPEMPIWTDIPGVYFVTHPSEVPALPSQFDVHVERFGGLYTEDALVCLWKGSEVYERGYTDAEGNVSFNISPATTGPLLVTVTKRNFMPYLGQAEVTGNTPPVCIAPGDTTIFQCSPSEVVLPVGCFDYEGNLASGPELVKGSGQIIGNNWYYTPAGEDSVSATIGCTDSLGYSCETTFIIMFIQNDAPVCTLPADTAIVQVSPPSEITLPVTFSDNDDNVEECVVINGPGEVSDGFWRYTPSDDETVNVTVRVSDSCDAYDEGSFQIDYQVYICGDADDSKDVNLLDVTFLINYLYKEGSAPNPIEAGDANANNAVNILDVTFLINYLYKGGPAPCEIPE